MNTMKLKIAAFVVSAAACGILSAKTDINPPVLDSVQYDGTVRTATVPVSDKWTLAFAESGEHVGTYDVFLRLMDFDTYKWTGSDERTIAVPFSVTQADNAWTDGPTISGWTFGGVPSVPQATAMFGAVKPVVYSGTTASGAAVANAAAVNEAGNYTATFDVEGTSDYTALHAEVPFVVSRQDVSGGGFAVSVGTNPKYNGAEQTLAVNSVTFNGESIPYDVSGNTATHAGAYVLTVSASGNYAGTTNIEWKILPRSVTLTSGSAAKIYDGAVLTNDEVLVSGDGFVNGEGATFTVTGSRAEVGTSSNTFTYEFTSGTVASDYQIDTSNGSLTISKAENSWTVEPSAANKTYDGLPYAAENGTPAFGTVSVKFSGTTSVGTAVSGVDTVTVPGDYTADFTVAETANYSGLNKSLPFSILPKDITGADFVVTVGANPKYSGVEQTIAIQSVTYNGNSIPYTSSGSKGANAGDYTLTITATGNYTGTKNVAWKILPRSVTLTSGSATKVYDGTALTKSGVSVSGDGFVGSEGATYSVTGSRTDAGTAENAFTYQLKSGTLAGNYQIATVKGTLTVTKATNSWTTEPSVAGKKYDGTSVASNNGTAKFGTVTVAFSPGGNAAPVNAGSYTATFSVAGNANYTALSKAVQFAIQPRSVTLTSGSASKVYDGTALTKSGVAVSGDGFAGSEGATYSVTGSRTDAGSGENTFTYQLKSGTLAGNYQIATVKGTLTVTKATNSWTTEPTVSGKTYDGTTVSYNVGIPKFGSSTVTFSPGGSVPIEIGSYSANFRVPGTDNYTALAKTVTFVIDPAPVVMATLSGEARWKLLKATGTYFAQIKVKCTDGYAAGISNLRIGFADRTASGKVLAQLWSSTNRSAVSGVFSNSGSTYRVVPISASSITGENVETIYGVSSLSAAIIPVAERTIEMYVPKRDLASHLNEYTAILVWESNGVTYTTPVVNRSVQ